MIPQAINRYKTVQVTTSSPGDLLVLMFDALFRFLGEAKEACGKDRARFGERVTRCHAILGELASGLNPEVAPELCNNLEGIYLFCMGHLVEANLHQDASRLDAVIRILEPVRDAFKQAVAQEKKQPAAKPTARAVAP